MENITSYSLQELYEGEENFLGKGRGKKRLQNLGQKIKEKVQNIGKTIREPEWIPLTPFKPVLQKMLRNRGVNAEGSLPEVGRRFFQVVIQGKKNYEEFVDPVTAGVIVNAIIQFIKGIQEKKKAGNETEEERDVLNDVAMFAGAALQAPDETFSTKNLTREFSPSGNSSVTTFTQTSSGSSEEEPKKDSKGLLIGAALIAVALMMKK